MADPKLSLSPGARLDLFEAADWYREQQPDLEERFLDEVNRALARLLNHPRVHRPRRDGTRRILLRKFRYSVVYMIEDDVIVIVAVSHYRRRENYWRKRLQ